MKHLSYIIAALMLIIASCKEDIDLDIKDTTGTLCVNGFLYSDCDTNLLYITKTGVAYPQNVKNAHVKMFVNGVLTEEKSQSDTSIGKLYYLHTKFSEGDLVRIEVDCDGQHVWSESTVPQSPKDLEAKVTYEPKKTYYDSEMEEFETEDFYRVEVSFSDISSSKNHYRLFTNKDVNIRCPEPIIEAKYDTLIDEFTGEPYEWYVGDTVVGFNWNTFPGYNYELYIRESPELVDEEMTANSDLLDISTYNYYKIFTNSRFTGGKCNMRVYEKVKFHSYFGYISNSSIPPETVTIHNLLDSATVPEFNYTEYVGIETIDEDTYYYVKALNGFESGNFDEQELTGAIKMRRNVHGGSGNISIIARTVKKIVVYDHYKPKWEYKEYDDDYY
ncbi:MAG: DUF4249 domain-containing protein [Bacteroidales bacterium]|nr:DUF4249 domain-containing protein [Bacteroidales bacterium]